MNEAPRVRETGWPAGHHPGDVARARMYVATVSRALNGTPQRSAATRERVQAVALENSDHRERRCAQLISGARRRVACCCPDLYGRVILGADRGHPDGRGARHGPASACSRVPRRSGRKRRGGIKAMSGRVDGC